MSQINVNTIAPQSGSLVTFSSNLTATDKTGSFGHLIVAGNITASGTVRADAFESVNGGTAIDFNDSINVTGNLTASGDLSIDDLTTSGNITIGGNISGSATSTGSFGYVKADTFEGVFSFSDGTAELISGSSTSTGSFGSLSVGLSKPANGVDLHAQDKFRLSNSNGAYMDVLNNGANIIFDHWPGNFQFKQGDVEFITANQKISGSSTSTGSFGGVFSAGKSRFMGNVGIGDTNPTMNLSVQDDAPTVIIKGTNTGDGAGNARLYLLASNQSDAFIRFTRDNSGNDWAMGLDHSDSQKFKISDNGTLGTNDRLVIDTSGNVAFTGDITVEDIGASIKLMESGDNAYFATLSSFHNAGDSFSLVGIKGDYLKHIRTDDSDENTHTLRIGGAMKRVDIFSNGNQRLLIDQDGKVGIGTASPTSLLTVSGSGAELRVHSSDENVNQSLIKIGSDLHASNSKDAWMLFLTGQATADRTMAIGNTYDGKFKVSYLADRTTAPTGGDEIFTVDGQNSRVGIGTDSPADKLQVAGKTIVGTHNSNAHGLFIESTHATNKYGGITAGYADNNQQVGLKFTVRDTDGAANNVINLDHDAVDFFKANYKISGSSTSTGSFGRIEANGGNGLVAAAGIEFPATQVASTNANTLDDYEEGTWTPTYFNITDGANVTATYDDTRFGFYTKIGRVITLSCFIRTDAVTAPDATDVIGIGGLPFTIAAASDGHSLYPTSRFLITATDFADNPQTISVGEDEAFARLFTDVWASIDTDVNHLTLGNDLTAGSSANKNMLAFSITYQL